MDDVYSGTILRNNVCDAVCEDVCAHVCISYDPIERVMRMCDTGLKRDDYIMGVYNIYTCIYIYMYNQPTDEETS